MSAPVLWWASWNDRTQNSPRRGIPVEGVVAWWITGWAADESYRTIVALVSAKTKRDVGMILGTDWPSYDGPRDWRFCRKMEPKFLEADVLPPVRVLEIVDRFPFEKWSIERLRALGCCLRALS